MNQEERKIDRYKALERKNEELEDENDQLRSLLQGHEANDVLSDDNARRRNRFETVFENS